MKAMLLAIFCGFILSAEAVIVPGGKMYTSQNLNTPQTPEIKKLIGKKILIIQRLQLKLLQKKIKRHLQKAEEITDRQKRFGKLSMYLAFGGIALLLLQSVIGAFAVLCIPAAIAAIILGIKSLKGNSNTPGLVGLIAGSATILFIILYTVFVAVSFSDL